MTELLPMNGTVLSARRTRMTETALELASDLTAEEWEEIGHTLGRAHRASAWWIGDWVNYGEDAGYVSRDKYDIAETLTELKRKTLWDYAWVARQFESSIRIEDLAFAHHQAVAARPRGERIALLEEASEKDWTVAVLREHVPATRPGSKRDKHKEILVHVDALARLAERWERSMTDALTPPQAKKQLTVLRKAHVLLGEVIEAVEFRADTLHTFLGR